MRVIAGSARGRRLKTLEGMDVRPTTDKVKEAIFSAIQFDLPDAAVLDLFAGSGQMGIEALSRGAASVGMHEKLLPLLAEHMADNGIVICEHETGLEMPQSVGVLEQKKQKKYGAITVTTYICRRD